MTNDATNDATNRVASTRAPRGSPGAREGEGVTHRRLQANGIGMHVAEAGTGSGPLVVLLHGFPELWYSWRHQLPFLAAAGFHAVAPDLRGYGGSDASAADADEGYAPSNLAADVVGLLDALDAEQAVLVGHDWGANIAWACAELFAERVAGLVALSVPYRPRPPAPPSEVLRQFVGGDAPASAPASPYPLGVTEAELAADPRRSMRRFLYALSGDAPPELVPRLFKERAPVGRVLDSMPEPVELPGWLGEEDLDAYARAYARTGFWGPLGVYRNQDRDWHEHPEIGTAGVRQPALFIGGRPGGGRGRGHGCGCGCGSPPRRPGCARWCGPGGQGGDRAGQQARVGRIAHACLHHGGVGPELVAAQHLVGGGGGQQRLVELGDGGGTDPAAAGQLDQGGRMGHLAAQGDAAKPLPGDRVGDLAAQQLIAQLVAELQERHPQVGLDRDRRPPDDRVEVGPERFPKRRVVQPGRPAGDPPWPARRAARGAGRAGSPPTGWLGVGGPQHHRSNPLWHNRLS